MPLLPFQVLANLAFDAILFQNQEGTILFANAAAERMFGYSFAELVGGPLDRLLPESIRGSHQRWVATFAQGPMGARLMSRRPVVRGRHQSGHEFPAEASIAKLEVGGEILLAVVMRDVSECRRLEEALRESEIRYRLLMTFASDAIFSCDDQLQVLEVNQLAQELLGYSEAELVGKRIPELLHPDDQPRLTDAVHHMKDGLPYLGEWRLLRRDGTWAEVEDSSRLLPDGRIVAMLRDIGPRKQQEAAQRRVERALRVLAAAGERIGESLAPQSVADALAGLVVPELAQLCWVLLLNDEGLVAQEALRAVDPQIEAGLQQLRGALPLEPTRLPPLALVLRSAQVEVLPITSDELHLGVGDMENRQLLHQGALHRLGLPLHARGRTLGAMLVGRPEHEGPYRADEISLLTDLARRASVALDNGRLYEQAQRAVAVRDRVLRIVAHDLRSPLSSISLATQMLQRGEGLSPKQRNNIDYIARANARCDRLIEDLLDVAQIAAGTLRVRTAPQEPAALVRCAVEQEHLRMTEAELELTVDIAPDLPAVQADGPRVQQVLGNLLGNALKFTPPGGRIMVRTWADGVQVYFLVQDSGIGLRPADQVHLFEPFWKAQPEARSGAGLGLSIARALVEAQGGRIWVESEVGAGSTFTFSLPRAPAPPS